ncbi:MAG: lipid-A-disaccharide synthase [Saprospiraceae bacterium]|nr:lipid-A-disaccharide synthase [Saprospiraceae bacterium]
MKYYLIAGEASGDLHGSNLMKALVKHDPEASFRFWGGDRMQEVADELVTHYRDIAFMGFVEVLKNIGLILKGISKCKEDILQFAPDALILIDYPGFNLRIAKWASKQGLNVQYYISPQVWAWKSHRAKQIANWSQNLFVILPFEEQFYQERGLKATFVGHPLLDAVATYTPSDLHMQMEERHTGSEKPIVALLPGSRKQEVSIMLTIMLMAARDFPDYHFVIAGVSTLPNRIYKDAMAQQDVGLVVDQTYDLLHRASFALVTSGTATLETALFGVPQIVCYKGGILNYLIAKQIVNVPYISLVNLILDEPLVEELVQHDLTVRQLRSSLEQLLKPQTQEKLREGYDRLRIILGNQGTSERVAQEIISSLSPSS